MLADLLPATCSRLRIFLCHAHADRAVAEEIAQTLKNDGHLVFFDKDSLPAASDYNEQIRKAIRASDRFVFLVSRASLAEGKFTLSELAFAKERWPNAEGNILPVLIDRGAEIAQVPAYLRSVHILQIEGNAPAEVAAAIEKSRSVRGACKAVLSLIVLAVLGAGLAVATGTNPLATRADFALLTPEQIDLRPAIRPGRGEAWLDSDVMLSIVPVQYSNTGGRPVRIHRETAEFKVGSSKWDYRWYNEVEITQKGCESDWLCTKGGIGAETLEPGRTRRRDTMFIQQGGAKLSYRALLTSVFDPAVATIEAKLIASTETSGMAAPTRQDKEMVCRIDAAKYRAALLATGFTGKSPPYPTRISPQCGGGGR